MAKKISGKGRVRSTHLRFDGQDRKNLKVILDNSRVSGIVNVVRMLLARQARFLKWMKESNAEFYCEHDQVGENGEKKRVRSLMNMRLE